MQVLKIYVKLHILQRVNAMSVMKEEWLTLEIAVQGFYYIFIKHYLINNFSRNIGWLGGCGAMKCTGLANWFLEDTDGEFMGNGIPL